jgi:protease I
MDQHILEGCMVAILATDGFEQSELIEPKKSLEKAGALVQIVSLKSGTIRAWDKKDWGKSIDVDKVVGSVDPEDFDALMLPGGVMNPDRLRIEPKAIEFIKSFVDAGKPIAAICHGPWTLIEAGAVKGRTMTSWPSLKTDLINAGANWVDRAMVTDNGLVTSRKPADLPQFCEKMIEEFAEGVHEVLPQMADTGKSKTVSGTLEEMH